MTESESRSLGRGSLSSLHPRELRNLQALLSARARLRLEESLGAFVREAWPVLEPGRRYVHGFHIDAICEFLTAVSEGRIRRLIITVPPRHMKSILTSVLWPTWWWTAHPESRWVFASYSARLSIKHNLDRRAVIQSEWYQYLWRDRFGLTEEQNEKSE